MSFFLMGDERYSERVLGVCMMDTMIDGMNSARKKKGEEKRGFGPWHLASGKAQCSERFIYVYDYRSSGCSSSVFDTTTTNERTRMIQSYRCNFRSNHGSQTVFGSILYILLEFTRTDVPA